MRVNRSSNRALSPVDGCALANCFSFPFFRASSRLKYLPVAILFFSNICFANTEYHHEVWHNPEYTDLYNPSPSPSEPTQPKEQQSRYKQQESEIGKETISRIDSQHSTWDSYKDNQEKSTNERIADYTRWLAFFTFMLVIVAGFQVWILKGHEVHLVASSKAAEESVQAAMITAKSSQKSIETMWGTNEIEMRAYLGAKRGTLKFLTENILRGEVIIANGGRTPAHDMRWAIIGAIRPADDPGEFPTPDFGPCREPIPPNFEVAIGYEFDPITEGQISDICARKLFVYVWGHIEYWDIYDRRQIVNFRYRNVVAKIGLDSQTGQRAIVSWEWYPEEIGNEAT